MLAGQLPFDPAGGPCTPFSIGSFTSSVIGCGITGGLETAGDVWKTLTAFGLGVERRACLGASFLSFTRCLFTQSGTLPMLLSACGLTCTVVAISCNRGKQGEKQIYK
jgi:hypothetical protein